MTTCHSARPKCSSTYQCPVPGLSQSFLFLLSLPKGKHKALLTRVKRDTACPQSRVYLLECYHCLPTPTLAFSTPLHNFGLGCSDRSAHSLQPRKPLRRRGGGGGGGRWDIRKQHQLFAKSTSIGKLPSVPQPDVREQPWTIGQRLSSLRKWAHRQNFPPGTKVGTVQVWSI